MNKRKLNLVCAILALMIFTIVLASYEPVPAPEPMGEFVIAKGEVFYGEIEIEDPNGPEGIILICEPSGLIISEPNILVIWTDPNTGEQARRYTYPFNYTPASAGKKTFTVISTDTEGITVEQEIVFIVKGNAPHIFTGCRKVSEPHVSMNYFFWDMYEAKPPAEWPVLVGRGFYPHEILRRIE